MRVLTLEGTHYEMGFQHGTLIAPMRPLLSRRIHSRLQKLPPHPLTDVWYGEVVALLEREAPGFLQYAQGQADGLGVDRNLLLRFSLASYLEDRAKSPVAIVAEGCTAWAARPDWTQTGQPILAKNRDQSLNLLGLQPAELLERLGAAFGLNLDPAGSLAVLWRAVTDRLTEYR
ncbi:MAG: hypothetical protein QHH80_09665, partial [Anaerolineae bacterium]|nr:hypothetical protein [Anaerolineae bacterium]